MEALYTGDMKMPFGFGFGTRIQAAIGRRQKYWYPREILELPKGLFDIMIDASWPFARGGPGTEGLQAAEFSGEDIAHMEAEDHPVQVDKPKLSQTVEAQKLDQLISYVDELAKQQVAIKSDLIRLQKFQTPKAARPQASKSKFNK
jgi:hypothetical protein